MFGITLWEMLVRRMPYSKRAAHEAALLVCTEGLRPSIPRKLRHGAAPYVELMEACWNANPSDRPSMTEVVDKLTEYHHQLVARRARRASIAQGQATTPQPTA